MDNKTRRDKELAYVADREVILEMSECKKLLQELNFMDRSDYSGIAQVVKKLLGRSEGAFINPPFYCDYGSHIEVGRGFFANYNCTIIDVARVTFGDNCMLGPNVAIYTAGHPIYASVRNSSYEYGKAVQVGDNVWLGGNTVVCPGVQIGSNTVIGAGSVVTREIPCWCVAAGNPCRVIRKITEDDKRKLFRDEQIDPEAWEKIVAGGFDKL